jgi:drug/metabolite transporter (DMT)-like permease
MAIPTRMRSFFMIAFLVLVWGLCWPVYKASLNFTPPILFAGMRTLLGGLGLAIIAIPRYRRIRFRRTWHIYFIAAFLNSIVFFGGQTVGLTYLPAGLFSVIVYLQPVLVGIFAWLWLGEALTSVKLLGLLLGFLGVLAAGLNEFLGNASVIGVVLALITASGWALGTVYFKKMGDRVDSLWLIAFQCLLGGAAMTIVGFTVENPAEIVWNNGIYWSGLVFGAAFGISSAWIVYFKLVQAGEASQVASFTFLVPMISVLVSVVFLGESFTLDLLTGMFFIILSIYLVNRNPKRSPFQDAVPGDLIEKKGSN